MILLDTLPEQAFDDITFMASAICETPIALVSLVDGARQWFKSKVGLTVDETDKDIAFCTHTLLEPSQMLICSDTAEDVRFFDNPLVTGYPEIRFYAGAALCTPTGEGLGTICVIDREPRILNEMQIDALRALARITMSQLHLRKATKDLADYRKVRKEELLTDLLGFTTSRPEESS